MTGGFAYPSRGCVPIDFVTIAPAPQSIIRCMLPASSSMIPEANKVGFFNRSGPIVVLMSTTRSPHREMSACIKSFSPVFNDGWGKTTYVNNR